MQEALDKIKAWSYDDVEGWFAFCKSLWLYPVMWRESEGQDRRIIKVSTGGLSHNENIINHMKEHVFWPLHWKVSVKGGLHIFVLPKKEVSRGEEYTIL